MEPTGPEDKMPGSIYVLLKRFVENTYDYSTWMRLLEDAGITHPGYSMHEIYPTSEIYAIVHAASARTGLTPYVLMEKYGEFLVPDLLLIYNKYIDPSWQTYEMLLNTENTFHGAVKQQDSRTSPPVLAVAKEGEKRLLVTYCSKRRMAGVAVGIIRGIAAYYHESDRVVVTRLTPPEEESVQIQVDFIR